MVPSPIPSPTAYLPPFPDFVQSPQTLFVELFLWLNASSSHICVILNNIMELKLLNFDTLAGCFMQQSIKFTEGLKQMTWFLLVL